LTTPARRTIIEHDQGDRHLTVYDLGVLTMTEHPPSDEVVPDQLEIEVHAGEEELVIAVRGELDLLSVRELERVLEDAYRAASALIVLDLAELEFTDSTGLRVLLRAQQRAECDGLRLGLRNVPAQMRRLFEMTRTERYFTILD
jgi:anti-sigma B factor antagonist